MPTNNLDVAQLAAGGVAALITLAFLLQKFLNNWNSSRAENSVIGIMHTELERLSEQNTKLSTELNKLQLEIITLNTELRKLSSENQKLHSEVTALTGEVARLQAVLQQGAHNGRTS
jgi:peptidoglycan hydrolase CwlO-like protein